jgi:hypothetical protein
VKPWKLISGYKTLHLLGPIILIFTTVKTSNLTSLDLSLRSILFPRKSNPWQNLKIYEIMVMNGMTGSEKDNPLAERE